MISKIVSYVAALVLIWASVALGADGYNITILTQDSTPGADTILYCIDDPLGTPLNRKCRVGDLIKGMSHTDMLDKGTNTHGLIDTHISTTHLFLTDLLDEDTMASDSSTKPASQQSIKYYVDAGDHSNGGNCNTGYYPAGVDQFGAVEGCVAASVEISSLISTHVLVTDAHHTATVDTGPSPDCSGTSTYQDGEGNCDDTSGFVITCSDTNVLGTDCGSTHDLTTGFIVGIASGTVILPAVATGVYGCVKATTAATINVDPNASDRFILDGVALADGDKLTSTGTIDETICFYADSASGWTTLFNPHVFTDGN